jgi:transposase InsO family protein
MEIERESLNAGRTIKAYRSDTGNGTFTAQSMIQHIEDNAQTISFSGAGAQHQNAVAESGIR